jgi:hypothetical protein
MTPSRTPSRATVAAFALVVLSPLVAWLLWVSWSDSKASDAMHVAWFATVAVGCVAAGALAPGRGTRAWLAAVAVLSTLATLFWWWSAQDDSGLFIVGLVLATPLLVAASVPLLWIGRVVASRVGSRAVGDGGA